MTPSYLIAHLKDVLLHQSGREGVDGPAPQGVDGSAPQGRLLPAQTPPHHPQLQGRLVAPQGHRLQVGAALREPRLQRGGVRTWRTPTRRLAHRDIQQTVRPCLACTVSPSWLNRTRFKKKKIFVHRTSDSENLLVRLNRHLSATLSCNSASAACS